MKRVIISSKSSKYLNYTVDVVFNLDIEQLETKVAASTINDIIQAINHPEKPGRNAIILSDRGLQTYRDAIRNLIGTVLGQGFYIDEDYTRSKLQSNELQSKQSYAIYPSFKLSNYPEAGEFNLITRFAEHDDRNIPLKSGTSLKTIQVFCKADVDVSGNLNISINNLSLQKQVIQACNEFKEEVAEMLDLLSMYKDWFSWIATRLNGKFEYQPTKRYKIFHIKKDGLDVQIRDTDLISVMSKSEAYKLVVDSLEDLKD